MAQASRRASGSTIRVVTPNRLSTSRKSLYVPPYSAVAATTSSQPETWAITAAVIAPIPLPKSTQDSAPSRRASASSAARTVGFSSRLYMYKPPSPRA